MKIPIKMDDLGGTRIFRNIHIYIGLEYGRNSSGLELLSCQISS